jgi:TolB-like protein
MIAVLPFESLSGDPGEELFSDGMTHEMINWLGRLDAPRLGVIAATSAMKYKNSPKTISEIGRELGVDYVLEGSVQQVGGRVRIAAQLIAVKNQAHLWAESTIATRVTSC